jgi:glycosyltransferase involved in cell wall biosynthesis
MTEAGPRPLFSVIIPTRNRASLFAVALQSVLDQRFREFEVIVVNDGSSEEHAPRYRDILEAAAGRTRLLTLVRTERGHGQSYALNFGAASAHGDYLCFLDDDDQWIDAEHLSRAAAVIAARAERTDLVLANQKAFRNGVPIEGVVWIEDLQDHLKSTPDATGAYTVTATELLLCQAHCHLNTTIVSRDFFLEIGGLDEGLRYECDRDVYLRAIDRARLIRFLPNTVSRHNIPDPAAGASMSTAESEMSKRLYQLRVLDKAVLFTVRPELRHYAMRHRLYVLEHIAAEASRAGRPDCATYYRREALMAKVARGWSDIVGRFARRSRVSDLPPR